VSAADAVERSDKAIDVTDMLEWLLLASGAPDRMCSDNGPELVASTARDWLNKRDYQMIYIAPGSPGRTHLSRASFGMLSRECLDRYLFINGREAQQVIAAWQYEYHYFRLRSLLNFVTPAEIVRQQLAVAGLAAANVLPACESRLILPNVSSTLFGVTTMPTQNVPGTY
jgi:hypothetical protein